MSEHPRRSLNASFSGATSTPRNRDSLLLSSSLRASTSALGKRGASDAGLDGAALSARRSMPPPVSTAALQQKLLASERREAELQVKIEEQRLELERYKHERDVLHRGETYERETNETREKEFDSDRVSTPTEELRQLRLASQVRDLRTKNVELENELQSVQSQYAQISGQHAALTQHSSQELSHLESRVKEVEMERDALRGWEKRCRSLTIELEEERRKFAQGRTDKEDEKAQSRADETLRKELRRQSAQFSFTQQKVGALESEVYELRQKKKEWDASERVQKDVERSLRDEVEKLHDQLERYRRDMDSLTVAFPASASSSEDLQTLQDRCATLSKLHQEANDELTGTKSVLREVENRLATLSESSTSAIAEVSKKLTEAERNLRWAVQGREMAERQETVLREEVQMLRSQTASGSGTTVTGDAAKRIRDLQSLVDKYRSELDGVARDSRALEDSLTQGAGLVKQALLDEANEKASRLENGALPLAFADADVSALEASIAELTTANTRLDAEINDLLRRTASGEYDPATQRCIELKLNPAAKEMAIRTKVLEGLRAENQALLDRLGEVDRTEVTPETEGRGLVPRESFDRLTKEKEDLEAAHKKRLDRLKEVFSMKSREFLDAVHSLLGWRIKFDESGRDIRLTSMYAPKGKMGLTLKFASQEGHFGTMQMIGAMARGLEESRRFWIDERQSVPGFLAQVTTEMFEKTTVGFISSEQGGANLQMGRAAGFVGLE